MPDHIYVTRFGWTPRDLILVPGCVVFIAVGTIMVVDGQKRLVGVLGAALGAAYLLLAIAAWSSRRVALAVTADGITLGRLPPWPASRAAFVPWPDIEAVVLWRQRMRWTSVRWIGVVRRDGAPPLPGSARSPVLRGMNKAFVPANLSEDAVADSRQISFWRLDRARLTAAVNHFGPDVPILDQT